MTATRIYYGGQREGGRVVPLVSLPAVLLESGDTLLLESGDRVLLEV